MYDLWCNRVFLGLTGRTPDQVKKATVVEIGSVRITKHILVVIIYFFLMLPPTIWILHQVQFFDLFFDCQGEGACWTDQDVLEGDLGWTQWHCLGQAGEESDIDTRQHRPGGSDFHFSCEHFVSRPALITSAKSRTGKRRPKCKGVLRSTYFRSNSIISIHLCLTDSPLRKLDRVLRKHD